MRVLVTGKLVQRSWQDNDGNKRQTVDIQVTHTWDRISVGYRGGSRVHRRGFGSASHGPSAASSAEEDLTT